MKKFTITLLITTIFVANIFAQEKFNCGEPFTDSRDGQAYNTVQIGDQCWMKENLNYETSNSWCYNNNFENCVVYGRLYNWDAAMGACPTGWHIPTDDEWKILEGTVDSQYPVGDPIWNNTGWRGYDAGEKLKSTTGWYSNGNGTNDFGFTALSGGYRFSNGSFGYLSSYATFWSSSEYSSNGAWYRLLYYGSSEVSRWYCSGGDYGRSVRCLKNLSSDLGLVTYYPFNGNANDESGNGNNGTVNGATLTTDRFGNTNSAYEFDGINKHIVVPNNSILNPSLITITLWIYLEKGGTQNPRIISKDGYFELITESDFDPTNNPRYLGFGINGTNELVVDDSLNHNEWLFITAVKTYDHAIVYFNGVEKKVENFQGFLNANSQNIFIGRRVNSYDNFKGKIDDIRIYNRALSEYEILALYNEGGLPYTSLNGTITDNLSSLPIENASIIITEDNNWYQTTSNEDGFYEFQDVESGIYNINVSKSGYISDSRYVELTTQSTYTEDFSLLPSNVNSLEITDGFLTAYADDPIIELEQNYYQLTGNVNINGILYFDGEIFIDKRNNLYYPEITGTCAFFASDIAGEDKEIYPGGLPFKFCADEDELTAKSMGYIYEIPIMLGGFPLTLAGMQVHENGDNIYLHVIPKFPFPLDEVIDYYSQGDVPTMYPFRYEHLA